MREITLTRGHVAFVSDEDFEFLSTFKWHVQISKHTCYAASHSKGVTTFMHRLILGAEKGINVDHVDGNGLNNVRENLRRCTQHGNSRNAFKRKPASSIYKGVSFYKRDQLWTAQIMVDRRYIHIGRFSTEAQAAQAYNRAAMVHFGDFARFNEIQVAA